MPHCFLQNQRDRVVWGISRLCGLDSYQCPVHQQSDCLGPIVTTAKWQTLNELQAKISKLRTEANPADKEAIEAINRLMDLHDRVRATRNSTLNLRTGLDFLNQLMLPLLAFLLANIDRLLEAVR